MEKGEKRQKVKRRERDEGRSGREIPALEEWSR